MKTFTVNKSEVVGRADIFVAAKYPQFSRSSLSGLFDKQLVKINNKIASASSKIKSDDIIEIDDTLLTAQPKPIDLPILYEDDNVIVMNKPAGMLTHSKGALNLESTIANWLLQHFKETNHNIISSFPGWHPVNNSSNRLGIVHRLDRGTSGVIIVAKNTKTLRWLQKQFSTRKVNKRYLAIVEGKINPPEAIIDAPIGRNPAKPQTFKVMSTGRPAQTKYKVINEFTKNGKLYSLVELAPKTGRTHQIRVHLKYINHPIVGDHVYGHGDGDILLHALSLQLQLPSEEIKEFSVEPPNIFNDFIKND